MISGSFYVPASRQPGSHRVPLPSKASCLGLNVVLRRPHSTAWIRSVTDLAAAIADEGAARVGNEGSAAVTDEGAAGVGDEAGTFAQFFLIFLVGIFVDSGRIILQRFFHVVLQGLVEFITPPGFDCFVGAEFNLLF